jgi:cell division septation protein DedD
MLLSGRSDTLKQESRQIELPAKPDEVTFEKRRFPVEVPARPAPASGQEDDGNEARDTREQAAENGSVPPGNAVLESSGTKEFTAPAEAVEDKSTSDNLDEKTKPLTNLEPAPPAVTTITLSSGREEDVNIPPVIDGTPDSPRYLVQVASFSSEKSANALADRLRAEKLPVMMDVVDRTAGRLHRVRVGPYAERADADAVVSLLRSKFEDLAPRVLDLRPTESAPVSTPSDPLVRWVVQVGSFGSSKSAEALVAKLRLAGLPAVSEKVTSANGTSYKVHVGPEIDRDKATELARKLKTEHKLNGFVTTQQ